MGEKKLRLIIAGTRTCYGINIVNDGIREFCREHKVTVDDIGVVLSGKSAGVDTYGEFWARSNGKVIAEYPARWAEHGRKAGPIRNKAMAEEADALLAIWDGKSRGTGDMIAKARKKGLKVTVYQYGDPLGMI